MRGAVSERAGELRMSFHRDRDDQNCLDCAGAAKEGSVEAVPGHTVDTLVLEGSAGLRVSPAVPIAILKTDTQGHEAQVLAGARRVLRSGRVRNVIVEFDLSLLRTRENALATVDRLLEVGMHCVHLAFAPVSEELEDPNRWAMFGQPVTNVTAESFLAYVKKVGKYTDLLCASRAQ